jgi:hypothetical protein
MANVGLFISPIALTTSFASLATHGEMSGEPLLDQFLSGPSPDVLLGTMASRRGASGGGGIPLAVRMRVVEGQLKLHLNSGPQGAIEPLFERQIKLLQSAVRGSALDKMPPELRAAVIDALNALEDVIDGPADRWKISERFQDSAYEELMDIWLDMARNNPSVVDVILLTKTLLVGQEVLYSHREKEELTQPPGVLAILRHLLGGRSPEMLCKLVAFLENEKFTSAAIQDVYDIVEIAGNAGLFSFTERLIAKMPEPKADASHEWNRLHELLSKMNVLSMDVSWKDLENATLTDLELIFGASNKKNVP